MSLSVLFLLVAVILFVVSSFGVNVPKVNLVGRHGVLRLLVLDCWRRLRDLMQYTELAAFAPQCFGCKKTSDGTLVLCHRNVGGWGLLAGFGIKSLALGGAILCSACHRYGDGEGRRDTQFWELAHQRTLTWAWSRGFVTFHKAGGPADEHLR